MIKVQDLHIGNLYIGYDSNFDIVDCNFFKMIEDGICIDEIIKSPIPLTEEILLKVGFDKEVNSSISSSSTWFYLPDFPLRKAGGFAKPMYYNLGTYDGVKIYTLHQLQNLYFSLTGQELNTAGLL